MVLRALKALKDIKGLVRPSNNLGLWGLIILAELDLI